MGSIMGSPIGRHLEAVWLAVHRNRPDIPMSYLHQCIQDNFHILVVRIIVCNPGWSISGNSVDAKMLHRSDIQCSAVVSRQCDNRSVRVRIKQGLVSRCQALCHSVQLHGIIVVVHDSVFHVVKGRPIPKFDGPLIPIADETVVTQ